MTNTQTKPENFQETLRISRSVRHPDPACSTTPE